MIELKSKIEVKKLNVLIISKINEFVIPLYVCLVFDSGNLK